jgi:hypothetical protein
VVASDALALALPALVSFYLFGCGAGKTTLGNNTMSKPTPIIAVTSSPGGARIFIDGKDSGAYSSVSGNAPTNVSIEHVTPEGSVHLVTLKLEGYYDWNMFVMLMPDSIVRVDAKLVSSSQAQTTGKLIITSEPEGAEVFLDGNPTNMKTPAELSGLSPTRHAIKLRLRDMELFDFVDMKPDGAVELHAVFDEPTKGSISGVVYNVNGDTMLDADVKLMLGEQVVATSRTTLFGTFLFRNIAPGRYTIRATAETPSGTLFGERSNIIVVSGRRTFNADVTVFPEGIVGGIQGRVTNKAGKPIEGAHVFTLIGLLSASSDVTDSSGRYRLTNVPEGSWIVEALALGYLRSRQQVYVEKGKTAQLDFVLEEAQKVLAPLPKPEPPSGTMLTYPATVSRGLNDGSKNAFISFLRLHRLDNLIKVLTAPRPRSKHKRMPASGFFIEADLWWKIISREDVLGYVVYRSFAESGGFKRVTTIYGTALPMFVDLSDEHTPLKPVRYAIALLSALNNESDMSDPIRLEPIGEARLKSPPNQAIIKVSEGERISFEWHPVDGATAYWVQLFSEFPTGAVDPQWETTSPLKVTNVAYDGPQLLRGKTYYWMVIASNSDEPKKATAFSYSELRQFIVQ